MHLIQDLVVDRAFAAAKIELTSAKFRALLGRATSRLAPPKLGPVISTRGKNDLSLGDYVWQMTYDLYLNSRDHLPQPEAVGFELQKLFFMK
jgi:hypothetical protein